MNYIKATNFITFRCWLTVNIIRQDKLKKEIADIMSVVPSWVSMCSTGYYTPVRRRTVEKFCIAMGHPEDTDEVWKLCQ